MMVHVTDRIPTRIVSPGMFIMYFLYCVCKLSKCLFMEHLLHTTVRACTSTLSVCFSVPNVLYFTNLVDKKAQNGFVIVLGSREKYRYRWRYVNQDKSVSNTRSIHYAFVTRCMSLTNRQMGSAAVQTQHYTHAMHSNKENIN